MSQQINLIDPLLLRQRHVLGLREMLIVLAGVALLALAWAGYLAWRASATEARAAAMEARQAAAQAELDRLMAQATRPTSALLRQRIATAEGQVKARETLLAALGSTLDTSSGGFSPRLVALARSATPGIWLDGFTLAADHVELRGGARDAATLTVYLERLGRQPPFAGMKFNTLRAAAAESAAPGAAAAQPVAPAADARPALPPHLAFTLVAGKPAAGTPPKEAAHGP